MPAVRAKLTYDDLLAAPEDGNRYELIEGEVEVSPSPVEKHQRAVFQIGYLLNRFIAPRKLGRVYAAPLDVVFTYFNAVQPDVLVILKDRYEIIERIIRGAPHLVVEVLSEATADRDRGVKLKLYERFGVDEYWIVDPDDESVEVYRRPAPAAPFALAATLVGSMHLTTPLLAGFDEAVSEIFREE